MSRKPLLYAVHLEGGQHVSALKVALPTYSAQYARYALDDAAKIVAANESATTSVVLWPDHLDADVVRTDGELAEAQRVVREVCELIRGEGDASA